MFDIMLDILVFISPIIAIFIFGCLDAAQTSRKDHPAESIFWRHGLSDWDKISRNVNEEEFRRNEARYGFNKFDFWYVGGNHWYPPHSQFGIFYAPMTEGKCADFWHQMKNFWTWCISLCAACCVISAWHFGPQWFLVFYLGLNGVEGITFNFFYKFVFRKKEYRDDKTVWQYLKHNLISHPRY